MHSRPSALLLQLYNALPDIPWDIKPVWGILIDSFPIAGSHSRSWIALASLLGIFCWWTIAATRLPAHLAASALIGTNVAMALPDVATDAAIAIRSRAQPGFAADLQVSRKALTVHRVSEGQLQHSCFQ